MYIFVGKFSENGNGKKYLHLTHISAFRHQIGRILIVHVSNVFFTHRLTLYETELTLSAFTLNES